MPQVVVKPPFELTVAGEAGDVIGAIRAAAAVADRVFADFTNASDLSEPEHVHGLAAALAVGLTGACDRLKLQAFEIPAVVDVLALKAAAAFLDGDLFASMQRFLGDAQGSFGLSACCSLDRNVVCIASRGQAMCLSFNADVGAVLWGSEAATQVKAMSVHFRICMPPFLGQYISRHLYASFPRPVDIHASLPRSV